MKRKKWVIMTAVAFLLGTAAVYAAFSAETDTGPIHFRTGSVDIDLETAAGVAESGEMKSEAVTANQLIEYKPIITGNRADCYVRLMVDIQMEKESAVPVTVENLYGLNEDWICKGNVIYCRNMIKSGDIAVPFDGIRTPKEWENDNASDFKIKLTADAIQAEYFVPDFALDAPWGLVEIQQAKETDPIDYRQVRKTDVDSHELVYERGQEFEITGDKFFGFNYILPGDVSSDTIDVRSAAKNNLTLYFKAKSDFNNKLFSNMNFRIYSGEELFYEGSLSAEKLAEYKEICSLAPGETNSLRFEVDLPEEVKNEFSVEHGNSVWYLKAVEDDASAPVIRTGDRRNILLPLFVSAGAIAIATAVTVRRRKRER